MRILTILYLLFCICMTLPLGWSLIKEAKLKKSLSGQNPNKEYRFIYGEIIEVSDVRYGPGDYETHCLIYYTVYEKGYLKNQRSLCGCGYVGQKVGLYYNLQNPKIAVIPNRYEPIENKSWRMTIGGVVIIIMGLFYTVWLVFEVFKLFITK